MTLLSKAQCQALRGIAIIGIFMHNYLHWLSPMVKENEYQFFQSNADRMLSELTSPTEDILYHLFSFFGHYGVPVFLFLSGYGLVKKYEAPQEPALEGMGSRVAAGRFLWKHYMKLFPMMLLGFVIFAMVDWMTPGHHQWSWQAIIAQLTMTINILPTPDRIIWPGPYWFFGLMMQLYLVYILVLHKRHWGWTVGLMVVCTLAQALCFADPEGETLNRLRYNCIGGMLPFGMGLLMARYEGRMSRRNNAWHLMALVLSIALTIVCSLNFWTWLLVPVLITVVHVTLVRLLPNVALRPLVWMGGLAAAIFVAHPVTRKIFIPISRHGDILDGLMLYIVATIVVSMMYRYAIEKLKEK